MLLSNVYEWHHFGLLIDVYMAPPFLESRQTGHAQRRWLINLPEPSLPAKKGWAVKNIDSPAWCCKLLAVSSYAVSILIHICLI